MPERRDRSTRWPRAKAPTTLSLPIIPLDGEPGTSGGRSGRPPASSDKLPAARQPLSLDRRRVPMVPDDWDDEDIPATRAMVAQRSQPRLPVAQTSLPSLPSMRAPAPVRSVKKGIVWQIVLLGIILATVLTSLRPAGSPQDALASAFQAQASAHRNVKITDLVPTFTQLDPTIGYLSTAQYNMYWNVDCGAAATSEVLTAWGDPRGAIGYVINDMVPHLTTAGMADPPGAFEAIARTHHFALVMTYSMTPAQLAQITEVQGIPVIVGVRDTYGGYYRYFAPGHYLVVVGADANGFQIVDSSTYYIHYLPTATFVSLWDNNFAVIFTSPSYGFQYP
jgi:hypothetical protein